MGLGTLAFAVPLAKYQHSARLLCLVILSVSMLVSIRLHSLRAFFAMIALVTQLLFLRYGPSAPFVPSYACALVGIDFALLLLVDDAFFDWEAVMWWVGLLTVQWTILTVTLRWSPSLLADVVTRRIVSPWGSVSVVQTVMVLSAALLLGKFVLFADAVGAGLVWALAPMFVAVQHAVGMEAYIALSGLAVGISVVERSHWIAYHDELTGLPGRRAFNEALAPLGNQYSIAIVDVDHFKSFNDTYGHETGDDVLRKVSGHLAKVGGGGTAYRCGGEEFAVLFPESGIEDASFYAEELRLAIEQNSFVVRGPSRSQRKRPERRSASKRGEHLLLVKTGVTVSIGIAEGTENSQDPQEVIAAADKALYRAKHLGRNRVECSAPRPTRKAQTEAAVRNAAAARQR